MSSDRLSHLLDQLEGDPAHIPPATGAWLRDALRRWACGLPIEQALGLSPAAARAERDRLITQHVNDLPVVTTTARARFIAREAKRLHSGQRSRYEWLARADRMARLPESARQYHNLLK